MRLDQFLRASRLVVRRTVAQELCEAGAVEVNGARARSARPVRAGDTVGVRRRGRLLTVRVLDLPQVRQPSRAAAAALYEVVSDQRIEDDPLAPAAHAFDAPAGDDADAPAGDDANATSAHPPDPSSDGPRDASAPADAGRGEEASDS